jgi:hypothetical protein
VEVNARRCPRRAARVYRGGEPSGDPSAFGLVTHIVSLPFEAIGQLWDKFVIEIARLVIFATALGAVFALGPSLLAFARPWLTVQVLWYAAYVVTARVRLGVPAALLLPPLARSLAASVLCALPALLVVRLFGADRVGGVRAAGTATLLVAAALWRTPPLVDARDAVARVLEVWRRPATFAGDAPVKAAAPIEP